MSKGDLTAVPGEYIETPMPVTVEPKYAKSEYWPIDKLKLWDKNPRSIKEGRFEELKTRLKRLGQTKPLRVTEGGTVIGGNMRLRAMREMGWDKVWVSISEAKTDREIFDDALTDNEEFGYYEQEQLAELALSIGLSPLELKTYEVSLGETTTLDLVVDKFGPEDVEEDEVPEVDETGEPKSKLGEIYQLGRHRLMCGDSTDADAVSELMDGKKADMVFTDPPYGYKYESNYQEKHKQLLNDDVFVDFLPSTTAYTKANVAFYVFCGWQTISEWVTMVKQSGLDLKNIIIWKKNNWSMGDLTGAYAGQYEIMLFAHKGRVKLNQERATDIWEFDRDPPSEHPTMKPVELVSKAIRQSSTKGDIVLDLFLGSGSTLIACEQTDRTCYGMELDPKYVDVIRKRYANHIGEGDRWQDVTPAVSKELVNA